MNSQIKENRIHYFWIDILRSLAIIFVVLCHATEAVYIFQPEFIVNLSLKSEVFAFVCETIGRLGVPIFCFISGYLLLNRIYDEKRIVRFWKQNLFRLFLVVEIWIIIYSVFSIGFYKEAFSLSEIIKKMLFLKSTGLGHTWYLGMILGMYLFVPFVANILQKLNTRMLAIPMLIVFFYLFIVPVINVIYQGVGKELLGNVLVLSWSGQEYGTLFILGALMKRQPLQRVRAGWLICLGAISGVFLVIIQMWSWEVGEGYVLWYNFAPLILCALTIFELISRIKAIRFVNIWRSLAACSFGIYLVHNLVKEYVLLAVRRINIILPVQVMLIFVITFFMSWGIVWTLGKHFKFARMLFYMPREKNGIPEK